jgi:DNA-binding transcriptional regulator YhcF (GntR family)
MAAMYRINPATAAKGINLLVDEGILYKKRGIGMFVATGAVNKILEKRKNTFYDNFILPLLDEANSLGITKEELSDMISKDKEK